MINPEDLYSSCHICPRNCSVNRISGERGICGMSHIPLLARAALHIWEEPCISGSQGSGALFFAGCSLHCVFCQNHEISFVPSFSSTKEVSENELVDLCLKLQAEGAHNINLVTPSHYLPSLLHILPHARKRGLTIPIVYNCGGYEKADMIRRLDGLIDIYLPDFKYMDSHLSMRYSNAPDYSRFAVEAIAEMVRQTGTPRFDDDGLMQKGTIVRHLLLPGQLLDSRKILRYLHTSYGSRIYISIMNQYTPVRSLKGYEELSRPVKKSSYRSLVDYAIKLGIEQAYIQQGGTISESFIPLFDKTGL